MKDGYILWFRKAEENPALQCDKFDELHAWLWLVEHANYKRTKIRFDGGYKTLQRGQLQTSVRKLAAVWGWGVHKVMDYLELLELNGMITRTSNTSGTLLTIENYSVYQDGGNTYDNANSNTNSNANSTQINKRKGNDPNGTTLESSVRGLVDSEFYNFELGEPLDAYW